MDTWSIEYWYDDGGNNSVELWLDSLDQAIFKAVIKELTLLQHNGNTLKLPHSRALGKGLFELRERHYGYRIYYGFHKNHTIIVYAAGDKQTQENDIAVARERLAAMPE